MEKKALTVLLIEDSPFDIRMIRDMLNSVDGNSFELISVERLSEGIEYLKKNKTDVLLLDLNLPDSRGLDSLTTLLSLPVKVPIVVISAEGGEQIALDAVKQGAQDYLVKGGLSGHLIGRSLRYAVERYQIEEDLRRAREELEMRVLERTEELFQANEQLKREAVERKKAGIILQESEEKWRNLFENSIEAVFTIDLAGTITSANRSMEDLVGYSQEELIGKNTVDLLKPDVGRFLKEAFNHLYKTGEPIINLTYTILTKSREERIVEGYINVIRKDNRTIGFQGTLRDITEKKRLEGQIQQTQKMEALAALAGGMAHNFNNILVGVMGYAEFLLKRKTENDPDYKAIKTIYEGTMRASDLTRQLMNTARAGKYNFIPLKLNDIVGSTINLIQGTFDEKITVSADLADDLMYIYADPGQIEQCLLNLVINARDAMPDGGRLMIGTSNFQADQEFARSHLGAMEGSYVVLSVSDTGHGIPAQIRGNIFEPFFTTKGERGGTGMGLSSAYGIIRSHKGLITVISEVDQGTTFRIYLPVIVPGAARLMSDEEEEKTREKKG